MILKETSTLPLMNYVMFYARIGHVIIYHVNFTCFLHFHYP